MSIVPECSDTSPDQQKLVGHRVCDPEDTLAWLRPKLHKMGITRLSDITGLDTIGIPVAQAVRPMGRSLSVSQGKGFTIEAALVSAAMEATEIWHAEFADLDIIYSTEAELLEAGHRLVPTASVAYGRRPCEETKLRRAHTKISWTTGKDLISGQTYLVPFDLVHMDYTVPNETDFLFRSSNGLAGGNTMDEAIASALHEAIERDCLADFSTIDPALQGRKRISTVALCDRWSSARSMISKIENSGLHVELFDVTNDIGVPAVTARIFETPNTSASGKVAANAGGSGAHLDPEIAIIRAVTEAAQSRLTKIAGVRDDLTPERYAPQGASSFAARLNAMADMVGQQALDFGHRDCSSKTADQDVAVLVGALEAAGVTQAICVDLTKPQFGIPVARMIVPGLGKIVHDWFEPGQRESVIRSS